VTPKELSEMIAGEKRELILAALRTGTIREEIYDKMMVMLGLVKSGPAAKSLDLENGVVLDDLIIEWNRAGRISSRNVCIARL
jgi:hypothetical protein